MSLDANYGLGKNPASGDDGIELKALVDKPHQQGPSHNPRAVMYACLAGAMFLLLLLIYSPRLIHVTPPSSCDSPFGSVIGVSSVGSVPAYSNCNSDYISDQSNFVNVTIANDVVVNDVYTGMQWQCVEYARRFWALTSPFTVFGSVNGASDIWSSLTEGTFIEQSDIVVPFALEKYPNNAANATSPPKTGDLLIYPIQPGGFPFGHVAVVVNSPSHAAMQTAAAKSKSSEATQALRVAEENWDSYPWAHANEGFSRELQLTYHVLTKRYSIYDPQGQIAGWVRRPEARP